MKLLVPKWRDYSGKTILALGAPYLMVFTNAWALAHGLQSFIMFALVSLLPVLLIHYVVFPTGQLFGMREAHKSFKHRMAMMQAAIDDGKIEISVNTAGVHSDKNPLSIVKIIPTNGKESSPWRTKNL